MPTFFRVYDQWGYEYVFATRDIKYITVNPHDGGISVYPLYDWRSYRITAEVYKAITGFDAPYQPAPEPEVTP